MKKENIVRYTLEELMALPEPVIDWTRVNALTDEDIERAIADDPDEQAFADPRYVKGPFKFNPTLAMAPPTQSIRLDLDKDLLSILKKTGRGYKSRINQMLHEII